LPDSSKRVPLQWGVPINKPPAIPTSDTCPPLAPKLTSSQEIRGKIERANQTPDVPSFDLGFESPNRIQDQGTSNNSNLPPAGITPVHLDGERFHIVEDDWDEATWREAVEVVEKAEREKGYRNGEPNSSTKSAHPQSCLQLPVMMENRTPLISQPPSSTTAAESGFQTPVRDENSTKLAS
jgi:hypothetical protein